MLLQGDPSERAVGDNADALGISAGNVRITQYRALTKLRRMIGDGGGL